MFVCLFLRGDSFIREATKFMSFQKYKKSGVEGEGVNNFVCIHSQWQEKNPGNALTFGSASWKL